MMILVLNAGSSTLKYKLYELPAATGRSALCCP
jgi:acetate kinase